MTLDNKQQQAILLQLIQNSQFGGAGIDQIFALKQAITGAQVAEQEHDRNCQSRAGGECSCK